MRTVCLVALLSTIFACSGQSEEPAAAAGYGGESAEAGAPASAGGVTASGGATVTPSGGAAGEEQEGGAGGLTGAAGGAPAEGGAEAGGAAGEAAGGLGGGAGEGGESVVSGGRASGGSASGGATAATGGAGGKGGATASGGATAACECTEGACCDGCNFLSADFVCDTEVETASRCTGPSGNYCDSGALYVARIERKVERQYCSGRSAQCDGQLVHRMYRSSPCGDREICVAGATPNAAACQLCPR